MTDTVSNFTAEQFDYDFWKDADKRVGWDDLEPGDVLASKPIKITKELIQRYARSIGDLNPLYFDEEYASQTKYQKQ